MISLDTNVLVRLLTNDDPAQAQQARIALDQARIAQERIWISVVVACELVWVLQRLYAYDRKHIVSALSAMLKFPSLDLEHPAAMKKAVNELARSPADFADILLGILSAEQGATFVLTFDKKAARLATHKLLT